MLLSRRRRLFQPALPHCGDKLLLVLFHLPHKRMIFSLLMGCRPQDHFRKNRSKIDSFRGQRINQLSSVRPVRLRGDDSIKFQFLKPICQYIRRDSFLGFQKVLVGPESSNHHVANDQQ